LELVDLAQCVASCCSEILAPSSRQRAVEQGALAAGLLAGGLRAMGTSIIAGWNSSRQAARALLEAPP
jgi:hypothetical protein